MHAAVIDALIDQHVTPFAAHDWATPPETHMYTNVGVTTVTDTTRSEFHKNNITRPRRRIIAIRLTIELSGARADVCAWHSIFHACARVKCQTPAVSFRTGPNQN
jgi:hypothetical protein